MMSDKSTHKPSFDAASTEENAVEVMPGLTRHWIGSPPILVMRFHKVGRDTVAAWSRAMDEIVDGWPANRPLLYVHQALTLGLMGLTPYIQQNARQAMRRTAILPGRTAVVIPRSLVLERMMLFIASQNPGKRQRRLFSDYETGLRWVAEFDMVSHVISH